VNGFNTNYEEIRGISSYFLLENRLTFDFSERK
jgi:hypothetical protein